MSPLLVGAITGLLSSCGLGGGTLLLIYLIEWAELPQKEAQGINLLFYLPMAICATVKHEKEGNISKPLIRPLLSGGIWGVLLGSICSSLVSAENLRLGFSYFLLSIGCWVLWNCCKNGSGHEDD